MVGLAFGTGAITWISRGPAVEAGVRRLPVTGSVAAKAREVQIARDDIPDYMPAMTMAFTLADESCGWRPRSRAVPLRSDQADPRRNVAVTGRGAPIP